MEDSMSATGVIVILIVITILSYIPSAHDYLMENEKNHGKCYRYIILAIDNLLYIPSFFLFCFACLKWIVGMYRNGEALLSEASSLWNWSGVLFVTALCLRLWVLPLYFPDEDE
jgi:uncharacterized membrane protein SpoIIM required for sporulation